MHSNSRHYFDAQRYIEKIAYNKANKTFSRHGQNRADSVYNQTVKRGQRLWAHLTSSLPWYEAEKWLRFYLGNEDCFNRPVQDAKNISETELKPGPECWAKNAIDEFETILKKVDDSLNGSKSEDRRKRQLETAVNNAVNFLAVKPGIYDAKRHGEWISEKKFNSMLGTLKEIVSKYDMVPTTQRAA